MLTYLRYTLAALCLAASVGCLALWWRSFSRLYIAHGGFFDPAQLLVLQSYGGLGEITSYPALSAIPRTWDLKSHGWEGPNEWDGPLEVQGQFGLVAGGPPAFGGGGRGIYFPLWYPALMFALAAVAALRLGRRFTIRSALIATTVVAGLLGMVVVV